MGCCVVSRCSIYGPLTSVNCSSLNSCCPRRKIGPMSGVLKSDVKMRAAARRERGDSTMVHLAEKMGIKIPLTEREVFMIVRSWKAVRIEMTRAGMLMFLRMFETSPEVKSVFEKFRTLDTPSDLWESTVLETHGMVVMSAIDEIISNLDDPETTLELVVEQGKSHAKFGDQVTAQLFMAVEEPFLHAVKETLSPNGHYPPHIERLYVMTIKFVIDTLVWGFDLGLKETKRQFQGDT